MPKASSHLQAVDGIRGILALCIAIMHYDLAYLRGAWLGVDIFFALSGFFLIFSLDKNDRTLPDFALGRIIRLYPMHFLSLMVFAGAMGAAAFMGATPLSYQDGYLYSFIMNLLLLHDSPFIHEGTWNSPSWFVAALFWSSIVFYFLVRARIALRFKIPILILIAAAGYGFIISRFDTLDYHHTNVWGVINISWLRALAGLSVGAVSYYIYMCFNKYTYMIANNRLLKNGFLILFFPFLTVFYLYNPHSTLWQLFIVLYWCLWFPLLLTTDNHPLQKLLSLPPLRYLGLWSYCIYLNQYVLKGITRYLHVDGFAGLIIYLIALIIYSAITFYITNKIQQRLERMVQKEKSRDHA